LAIIQISQIKHRRGLEENLPPALGSGELGWAQDSQRLFIGNGFIEEGAPQLGNTEILTEHSNVLELSGSYTFKGARATYNVATKHLSTLTEDFLAPTPRSVGDKLDDNANIRDFGGLGDAGTSALTKGDLIAINYAIEQLYNSTLLSSEARVRRSLHFPSGIYVLAGTVQQDYIHLLPHVKLEGAGKNSTFIIQINPAAECIIKAEPNGTMGATGLDISGITFITVPNIDILIADKVTDCRFDNVRFQKTSWSLATKPIPSISLSDTPFTAISPTPSGYPTCVKITNSVKNLSFNQCDFVGHYSAVHTGVLPTQISDFTFSRCLFTKLYSGIVVGINEQTTAVGAFISDGNGTTCNGVQVVNSVFDEITAHAIIGDNSPSNLVSGIISAGNIYRNVGSGLVDAINLSGDNCYSIGDIFPTTTLAVNFNDKKCFATLPDGQLRLGTQHYVGGSDIELSANTPAYNLAGVVGFKNYPTIVEYTLLRYGEQRVGSLKIAPVGTAIAYSDDYVETDDIGVTLKPQLSANGLTVELYYSAGIESVLKIASRTLTGIDNVPAPVLHAPDAPTNVTVVTVTNVLVGSGLWTVGYNYYGQLGDGTSGAGTDKSSPVQVGTLTNWKQVAAGFYHNAAIKTDGSLWTCGYNGSGQLGDGTTTHKSSPVQVGTLTNWAQVVSGYGHTAALR